MKHSKWLGLIAATWIAGNAYAEDPAELTVGLITTTSEAETVKNWQPIFDDMAAALKMPVKVIAAKDYGQIINGMKNGKVQVAWLGQKSALQAVVEANAEVFVHHLKADGTRGYTALLLANKVGDVKDLDQVLKSPGKYSYASGKSTSTSGFLMPNYYIFTKNEIDPRKHFKRIDMGGSHQDNFLAVANGKVDLATNNSDDMEDFKGKFPAEYSRVKVIWQSDPIGLDPMLYDKRLSSGLKQRIQQFFIGYGKEAGNRDQRKKLITAYDLAGFAKSDNRLLRRIAELESFSEQYALMIDDRIPTDQKDIKFKELFRKANETNRLLGGG